MIRPENYAGAVAALRFMAMPVTAGGGPKQFTMVQIDITTETTSPIDVLFMVPPVGNSADASFVVSAMGNAPVNDALDAWRFKKDIQDSHVVPVTFEPCPEKLQALSGCEQVAVVRVPNGPCVTTAGWVHDLPEWPGHPGMTAVFVPTMNTEMPGWRVDAVVAGCDAHPYGTPPTTPLSRSLRWDLAANAGVTVGQMDNAALITQWSEMLPFHNLWFPCAKRNPADRFYTGVSGAVVEDRTEQRLVACCDVGFQTIPVVCGCFLRDAVNYKKAHVPLAITERMTRAHGPFVISNNMGPIMNASIGGRTFVIRMEDRELFGGLLWVPITAI